MILSGAGIENKDAHGCTPLICAVEKNNSDLVKLLIEFGADPTGTNGSNLTALQIAENNRNRKIFYLLTSAQNKNKDK